MPIARYFVYVGSALLALLLVVNAYLPKPEAPVEQAAHASFNHSQIRITSNRVADKPIIFDTSQPTIVPPAAQQVAQAKPVQAATADPLDAKSVNTKTADASDAMAQMNSTPKPAATKPKPKPRKIARHDYPTRRYQYQYPNRQTAWAQPMFPSLFGSW